MMSGDPTTTSLMPLAAMSPNILGRGIPSVTYDDIVNTSNSSATDAIRPPDILNSNKALNPVDTTKKIMGDLAKAAAMSFITDNPVPLIVAAVNDFVDLFTMLAGGGNGPEDPVKAFQAEVDQKLQNIQGQLTQMSQIVGQITSLTGKIDLAVKDGELSTALNQMIPAASTIDVAFAQWTSLGAKIANSTTDPQVRADSIAAVYKLLSDDPTWGPEPVLKALTIHQSFTLGTQGNRGILGFLPQMVQGGWEACAMNIKTALDLAFDNRIPLQDGQGAFHDSVGWIAHACLRDAYTKMADAGRTVQGLLSTILTTQLKGFALLSAAYGNDPLYQYDLEQVAKVTKVIGTQIGSLWDHITDPSLVDATATRFMSLHAETLGPKRAGQTWYNGRDHGAGKPQKGCPANVCSLDYITFAIMDPIYGTPVPHLATPGTFDFTNWSAAVKTPITKFTGSENSDGTAQYIYWVTGPSDTTEWDMHLSQLPLPHANVPKKMPAFLEGIQSSFSEQQ